MVGFLSVKEISGHSLVRGRVPTCLTSQNQGNRVVASLSSLGQGLKAFVDHSFPLSEGLQCAFHVLHLKRRLFNER